MSSSTTTTSTTMDCLGYISRYNQRHLRALYNIPPPRLFPPSPYPQFTERELAMRRKVEILKYSNNSGAGTTKSQQWAQTTRTRTISQNRMSTNALACPADELIPTSTTKCDVPGPEDFLYYNPAVPLYQHATQQRAFATEPSPPYVWRPITQNIVENLTAQLEYIMPDEPSETNTYTVSCPVGVITTSNTVIVGSTIAFNLNISLAAWITGVYTGGSNQVNVETDAPFSLTISSITYQIMYNDVVVVSGAMTNAMAHAVTFGPENIPQPSGQFYGIQYVGTSSASNILIANVQSDNIYQVVLQVTYTYPRTKDGIVNVVDRLDVVQTGIVANVDVEHIDNTTDNFAFTSAPVRPFVAGNFLDYRTTLPIATLTATYRSLFQYYYICFVRAGLMHLLRSVNNCPDKHFSLSVVSRQLRWPWYSPTKHH